MRETNSSHNCSYILRLWNDGNTTWRVSVKRIPDGRWRGFASLDAATAYIGRCLSMNVQRKA